MRPTLTLLFALPLIHLAAPRPGLGQSSQFGVRGLGNPGRALSARTLGTAGAFGLFDSHSSTNPGALVGFGALEAAFTGVQDFRTAENPAGSASLRESRFPQFAVGGTVRGGPVTVGLSYSNYMSRDFTVVTADTLLLRGSPVGVSDTVASRGGIGDLRVAVAYHPGRWSVGAGLHVLTGSNRLRTRRIFSDSAYTPAAASAELSYAGVGLSAGVLGRLAQGLEVAATARADGSLKVDRDSSRIGQVDLPFSFGLGLRWRARPRLQLAGTAAAHTWSGANSDLVEQGGAGARNSFEVSLGGEYTPDLRRPARRPLRFGVRYGTLPFLLTPADSRPREFGIAAGTGTRFASDRAGVDLSLEGVWRSAGDFKERAWLISVGVLVQP